MACPRQWERVVQQWRAVGDERLLQYVVRRLLVTIPMLLGAMSLVFFAMHVLPGDPCMAMLGDQATGQALNDVG
jgi:hypothetical protein